LAYGLDRGARGECAFVLMRWDDADLPLSDYAPYRCHHLDRKSSPFSSGAHRLTQPVPQVWPPAFATKMVAFFLLFCSNAVGPILIVSPPCSPFYANAHAFALRAGCRNISEHQKSGALSSVSP
jgi:hypothetical protein